MKLSDYAKQRGITYRAAWNHFKLDKIPGAYKDGHTGQIIIPTYQETLLNKVAIYARVSSNENKDNLESQAERLKQYATARGYQIVHIVKEVGSGVNDNRKKLLKLMQQNDWGTLIVEHKDRLTRFGFNYIQALLENEGRKIEVVNLAEDDKTDLMQDLVAIIYLFSARMYGLRRSKRKTEQIIECLTKDADKDDPHLPIKTPGQQE
ncbi:MAG: IS607 family transposase [Bacillota bacterium]